MNEKIFTPIVIVGVYLFPKFTFPDHEMKAMGVRKRVCSKQRKEEWWFVTDYLSTSSILRQKCGFNYVL